jgi:hypothetical protein
MPLLATLQPFQGTALGVDRRAVLALAERALGLAHRALGVGEPLLALHPHAAHAPLHLLEPLAQGLLALAKALALALFAALTLGLLLALALLAGLALPLLARAARADADPVARADPAAGADRRAASAVAGLP